MPDAFLRLVQRLLANFVGRASALRLCRPAPPSQETPAASDHLPRHASPACACDVHKVRLGAAGSRSLNLAQRRRDAPFLRKGGGARCNSVVVVGRRGGKILVEVCALIVLAAALAFAPLAKGPSRTVVLLTMDGVRWDYPSMGNYPSFARLAREGAKAPRLAPVFPSLTFSSHAAIATGCAAEQNGIVSNVFLDRAGDRRFSDEKEASWIDEPPLWVLAERQGLRAAVSGWPCSTGPWRGVSPSFYHPFGQGGNDDETEKWIETQLSRNEGSRPALVMAWTSGADAPGHAEGPGSEEVRRAMARADRLLGRLLDFLSREGRKNYTTLLLASDHGMARVERSIDVASLIPKRGYYPFVAISGPLCNIYCKNQAQEEAVLRALRSAAPKIQIWRKAELPARLRYACPRTGDIILLAPPGTAFAPRGGYQSEGAPKGMHGYDPDNCPDMDGIFYAWGAQVAAGTKLPELTTLDVAPTACALLNIQPPPHAAGKSIRLR